MGTCVGVTWQLDGITMYGTLARPDGEGPFPAVVLVAGSGPTDRDWCSPLLPGTNGSGRLLADALADAGIASLRYDKRASGPHAAEHVAELTGKVSMRSHLEELAAAVDALVAHGFVDASRMAGLGNSEGTLHVLHYATTAQRHPFAGIVLAAPPGRPVGTVLLAQLAQQATLIPGGDALLPPIRAAAERYQAGQPMNLDPRLPDTMRKVLASFEAPPNLPLARELWTEDATASLPRVEVPALILIGGKDLQVNVRADGDPLRATAAEKPNVTFAFPLNANHVLKQETRPLDEIVTAPGSGYNQDGTKLDPETLETILTWLRTLFTSVR